MSTESSPKCPQCGTPLSEHAPAGLCPHCLMGLNLKTETVFTDDSPAAHPPLPPEQIAPHFPQLEILECLGRGGMGVVYKARQKSLNRLVALKLLAPERVRDARFAERFAREAQALAALNHPNIVTIYDFGQAGGFYFLLMEFVDGLNLRQLLRTRKFTPEEALAIVPPLCDALQFAHDRGIVHRDIKPENLLLGKAGNVKVADFGIAKMLGTANGAGPAGAAATAENATQNAVGTPSYSAPEQKTDPQRVDSRADIYSLGVVFYEMLTGELPGKKIEAPSKKVQIDVRLDEIVLRALETKPERRYQQVSDVKTMVETIVGTPPNPSPPGSAAEDRGPGRRAFPVLSSFLTGILVFALVTGIAFVYANLLPTTYAATTRVKLDQVIPSNQIPAGYPNYAVEAYDPYAIQTEFEIIRSEMVLSNVISRLNLNEVWGKKYFNGRILNSTETLEIVENCLDLQPIRNTSLISITCYRPSAAECAPLANAIAESFRDFSAALVRADVNSSKPVGKPAMVGNDRLYQIQIVDRAEIPRRPVKPNKPLIIVCGALVGIFFGIAIFVVRLIWHFFRQKSFEGAAISPAGDGKQKPDRFWRPTVVVAVLLFAVASAIVMFQLSHQLKAPVEELSQETFLQKFAADQIAHSTVTVNQSGLPLTEIRGTYFKAGQNGTLEEVPFEVHHVLLTPEMMSNLTRSPEIEIKESNVMLANVLWGLAPFVFIGVVILFFLGIIYIVWRLVRKTRDPSVPPIIQRSDRFWRWFAVVVLAMIAIPIAISILGLLAAIAIPNFVQARQRSLENARHIQAGAQNAGLDLGPAFPRWVTTNVQFVAPLNQGSVQLVGMRNQSATNTVAWLANGTVPDGPFFPGSPLTEYVRAGGSNLVGKRAVFWIRSETTNGPVSSARYYFNQESGIVVEGLTTMSDGPHSRHTTFYLDFLCATNSKMADMSFGVANGPWKVACILDHRNNFGGQVVSRAPGLIASYNSVSGDHGEVAVNCNYSKIKDRETRMVGVDDEGQTTVVSENAAQISSDQTGGILLMSSNAFTHLKEFQLQWRPYQWVEFRNVSLEPGYATKVEVKDADAMK